MGHGIEMAEWAGGGLPRLFPADWRSARFMVDAWEGMGF